MKSIILHGPAVRNDGTYVDAGTTVTVGDEPDQIAAERVKLMLSVGTPADQRAATAPAKE